MSSDRLDEADGIGPDDDEQTTPCVGRRPLNHWSMDAELANAISEGYERWAAAGDQSVQDLFSPDFYDNVSGQTGLAIFDVVGRWLAGAIMSSAVVFHARWFCPTFREAEAAR